MRLHKGGIPPALVSAGPFTVAAIPFIISLSIVARNPLPLLLYSAMSLLCGWMYRLDQQRAKEERWRIPDNSMHLTQLLYGWPGAIIAQQLYRHKVSKKAFQGALRFIIFLHLIGWIDYLAMDHLLLKSFIRFLTILTEM